MNDLENNNLNNLGSMFEQYEAPFGADEMQADWQQVANKIGAAGASGTSAGASAKGSSILNSLGAKIGAALIVVGAAIGVYTILNTPEELIVEKASDEPISATESTTILETFSSEEATETTTELEPSPQNAKFNSSSNDAKEKNKGKNISTPSGEKIEEVDAAEVDGKMTNNPKEEVIEQKPLIVLSSENICQNEGLKMTVKNGKAGKLYWYKMKHKQNGAIETGAFESKKTIKPTISGVYSVQVFEMNGAEQKLMYTGVVNVKPKPKAKFSTENTACGELTLNSECSNSADCYWTVENKSISGKQVNLSFNEAGFKKVTLIAEANGCADTLSKDVFAKKEVSLDELEIPTIFTPNNDGKNDEWEITTLNKGLERYDGQYEIRSNQTGNLVFESNSLDKTWNGQFMNVGKDCEPGYYTYIIKVNDPCSTGNQVIKTGLISITR
ncbi:MAG: gliding motility-associated C-terminal domain-containing protein [Bacteroidia bacterium]